MKVQINGRTLTKKGLATVVLAAGIAVSALGFTAFTVVEYTVDTVVAEVVATEEVSIIWGTEIESVVAAIESVNGELNGPKMKQAVNEFHNLNNTWAVNTDLSQIKAGTYTIPVIK